MEIIITIRKNAEIIRKFMQIANNYENNRAKNAFVEILCLNYFVAQPANALNDNLYSIACSYLPDIFRCAGKNYVASL